MKHLRSRHVHVVHVLAIFASFEQEDLDARVLCQAGGNNGTTRAASTTSSQFRRPMVTGDLQLARR